MHKNEINIISEMTHRKTANQQPKNMYVKLQKYLKEVTILHFFFLRFFIFKAQFMKINEAKTSILCLAYIYQKNWRYFIKKTIASDYHQYRANWPSPLCLVSRAY